nr:NADP-dependent malic enzyme [Haloechinothrix aidingensis]
MIENARSSTAEHTRPVTEEEIFDLHEDGKLAVNAVGSIADPRELAIAYTPGVAKVSEAIAQNPALASRYTWAHRMVAVVSDGTAVLGLGDIGASASLPVMEGKSALFKNFADLNAVPLVLDTTDVDEIVETLVRLRPSFGAVNLEDIAAPRCFEIEDRLKNELDCPVMHDDQHGTAIVVLAALRGANITLGRNLGEQRVVISGAGAAGVACARILQAAGVADVTLLDSRGILHEGREGLHPVKAELAASTNKAGLTGGLDEAMAGADVFIGLSGATIDENLLSVMAPDPIVFALSNPEPEVHPHVAGRYASVVATGRSDFPNQINNVLAFPGVFRGALDAGAHTITDNMKIAAAEAIATVAAEDLSVERIMPSALDPRVALEVATAVAKAAGEDGVV